MTRVCNRLCEWRKSYLILADSGKNVSIDAGEWQVLGRNIGIEGDWFEPHEILVLTEGLTFPALYVPSSGQIQVISPTLLDGCDETYYDLCTETESIIQMEMDDEAIFERVLAAAFQLSAED